ncbi:MAG: ATP-grasp domain-containing protein [Bacteroidota bacterium]
MIVFSESVPHPDAATNASQRDLYKGDQAARIQGCRIYYIPADFSSAGGAEGALDRVPQFEQPQPAVWLGFIPTPERYADLYAAAARRNIFLLNDPEAHLRAQEFDRMYPHLVELTPKSVVIRAPDEIEAAIAALGFPIFVKGAVQSRKSRGLKACLAENGAELRTLTAHLFALENRSRGRVIAREYVPLRHTRMAGQFPQGREYRLFIYREEILAWGYYWEEPDELAGLTAEEAAAVLGLGREAARRLGSPYVAVDIGQGVDGRWWVIETGDAQFSGLSQAPHLQLWARLARIQL